MDYYAEEANDFGSFRIYKQKQTKRVVVLLIDQKVMKLNQVEKQAQKSIPPG